MSWRRLPCSLRLLCGPVPLGTLPLALSRSLPSLHLWENRFCCGTQHSALNATAERGRASSQLVAKQTTEPFQPGLFHVDITASRTDGQVGNRNNANGERLRKRSYISYGTHLNPVIFRQLGQGWILGNDGAKKELFHPKLTPRLFYREASDEYSNSAVIYPQLTSEGIASGIHSQQVEVFLKRFWLETGIGEQNLSQLLASFLECSDEFLMGLASDTRFVEFTEFLGERCSQLPTGDFVRVLVLFARAQVRAKLSAVPIFLSECEARFSNWNLETSLLVCDAWRLIGLKVKSLNAKLFSQIEPKVEQLTKHQVVQLMYLIGENRFCQERLLDGLQEVILKYLDSFTMTELGTICQGFFKSKTNLKPPVVSALAKTIQSEQLECIHSFYLVGMLKVFRQAYFGHRDLFNHFADSISPHLHTYQITSVMHVLLTYATLHIHNDALLGAGSRTLLDRFQECRCKDLSKFLWSFGTLNYHPENSAEFFRTLIARMIELVDEYRDFPVFLVSGLLSLAYLNMYPAELLSLAFSEEFVLKLNEYAERSNIDPMRDMFLLHCSLTIECPDYRGNQLSKDFFLRKPFSRRMFGSLAYELSRRPLLAEVALSVASTLGGEKYIKLGFTLPHMKTADIEIHLDSSNQPVKITDLTGPTLSPSQFMRDKGVPLDPSLITNLAGNGTASIDPTGNRTASNKLTGNRTASSNPTGNTTAFSTPTGTRTADEPETTREARTDKIRNVNSGEPQTPSDKRLTVDKLVLDRAASFTRKNAASDWSSRFDVPKPLCRARVGGNRIAVLVWSRNHFHFNGKKLLGLHSMKKRQLEKLGYKTVEIPFFEWNNLTGSEERENYIRNKLLPNN